MQRAPRPEEAVNSMDSKAVVTPLRYDYKATDYKEGIHPASHVHFGFSNDIRVGTRKVMNPVSFVLFVIRQRYPDHWVKYLGIKSSPIICRNVRQNITDVDALYWKQNDSHELVLH